MNDLQPRNVDFEEINKFSSLADNWWNRNGEFKPLHDINPLRVDYIESHAGIRNRTILDVGCGGGILCEALTLRGGIVTGIDMSESSIAVAKLHSRKNNINITYAQATAEQWMEKYAESYDIVTCLEMLEHVPNPENVVAACSKLVKKNGHVFFSTLNKTYKSWLFAIVGAEYILHLLPKGTHNWHKFIHPATLAKYCRNNNLDVQHMTGMLYNPFTKNYRLHDSNLSVNYLVYAQRS